MAAVDCGLSSLLLATVWLLLDVVVTGAASALLWLVLSGELRPPPPPPVVMALSPATPVGPSTCEYEFCAVPFPPPPGLSVSLKNQIKNSLLELINTV